MNNPKSHINRPNINPERKQPWEVVYVRNARISQGTREVAQADAQMHQNDKAPKHPDKMFVSKGYLDYLTRQAVASSGNVVPIDKNKKAEEEYEHRVPDKISDHEVTSQPKGNLNLENDDQEQALDDIVIDAIGQPGATEEPGITAISEQPKINEQNAKNTNIEAARRTTSVSDKSDNNDKLAKVYQIEDARRKVAEAQKGSENGDIKQAAV